MEREREEDEYQHRQDQQLNSVSKNVTDMQTRLDSCAEQIRHRDDASEMSDYDALIILLYFPSTLLPHTAAVPPAAAAAATQAAAAVQSFRSISRLEI